MTFKDINRWDVWKMPNDIIPSFNSIREEAIHVPARLASSVAGLSGSGLNSNFHWWAHPFIISRSRLKSFADIFGSFTMEKKHSVTHKQINIRFNMFFKVIDVYKK